MITKIGHRGAAGYEPENTIRSFEKAIALKVDMIELDVQLCKSGELVVFHNNRIDGVYLASKTLTELRGKNPEIPTLEEVLASVNRRTKVNIEIKCEGAAKKLYQLLEEYAQEKGWKWDDFLVSSFNHYELREMQKCSEKVKIGVLIAGIPIGYAEGAAQLKAYSLNVSKEFINQKLVDDAHQRGLKVLVYTVNEKEEIEDLKSLGVDGIFSDFPDRI